MYVDDKVFLIELPGETNLYVILGERICLVDTGYGDLESINSLSTALRELNITFKDISYIVNTHAHSDHYWGTALIKHLSNAKVAIHKLAAPRIRDIQPIIRQRRKELAGRENDPKVRDFLETLSALKPLAADVILEDNDVIDLNNIKLRVIHTPGHALGHICLYDMERKLLFSGDHIVSGTKTGTVYIGPPNGSVLAYLDSLKRLSDLEIKMILSGHGPIIRDPRKKINDIFEHHRMREHQILNALDAEERTAEKIADTIYAGLDLGRWSAQRKRLTIGAVIGRLEKLIHDGLVEAIERDGEKYYRLK